MILSKLGWLALELLVWVGLILCAIYAVKGATGWETNWSAATAFICGYVMGRIKGAVP